MNKINDQQQAGKVPTFDAAVNALHLLANYLGDPPLDLNLDHEISLRDARDAIAYALSAQPSPGEGVRAQFEAWAKANGLETKLYAANGMYSHPVTRGAWIAWQARAAQPSRGIDGYQGAFYELAGMLGMAAQARSPKEVWETQMRPMLRELIAKNQPQAVAPFEAPSLPEGSREAAMVVLERDGPGRPTVWCDPGVVDLVKALNGAGIATVWSCDGHGHRPAVVGLKDGRQLLVLESVEALQQLAHLWPDINGQWRAP